MLAVILSSLAVTVEVLVLAGVVIAVFAVWSFWRSPEHQRVRR